MSFTGGCSCGAVRFAVRDYLYALVCHCDACKKRTGSAFGISVVVEKADLLELRGALQIYTRVAESGRPVDYEFCPTAWHAAGCEPRRRLARFAAPNRSGRSEPSA